MKSDNKSFRFFHFQREGLRIENNFLSESLESMMDDSMINVTDYLALRHRLKNNLCVRV